MTDRPLGFPPYNLFDKLLYRPPLIKSINSPQKSIITLPPLGLSSLPSTGGDAMLRAEFRGICSINEKWLLATIFWLYAAWFLWATATSIFRDGALQCNLC